VPWVGVAVLVAGVATFAVSRLDRGEATPRPAPLDPAARRVALEFVHTAVARRDLARAWHLAAPELRGDMTLEEWKTGTIPVVPYPVAKARVLLRTASSFTDEADLDVGMIGPGSKTGEFRLGLQRIDGHWLVSSWAPVGSAHP
jgi:hypothetical protein